MEKCAPATKNGGRPRKAIYQGITAVPEELGEFGECEGSRTVSFFRRPPQKLLPAPDHLISSAPGRAAPRHGRHGIPGNAARLIRDRASARLPVWQTGPWPGSGPRDAIAM